MQLSQQTLKEPLGADVMAAPSDSAVHLDGLEAALDEGGGEPVVSSRGSGEE
jgi:hypothetical protein